jgi:hypothetical protein
MNSFKEFPQNMKPNCRNNDYCDFKILLDNDEAQVERCVRCMRKVIYNKRDGRIDNEKYRKDHIRDFCQPFGVTSKVYEKVYGAKMLALRRRMLEKDAQRDTEDKKMEDGKADVKAALKIWKQLSARGYTEKEIIKELAKST